MTGIPISRLDLVPVINGDEKFPIVQNGVTSSANPALLASYLGGLQVGYTAYTTNHSMTAAQTTGTFSNAGAAGPVVLTLPTPAIVQLTYTFIVAAAQTLEIDVDGSDIITLGEIASSAGGFVSSDSPYSVITVKAISTTLWVATFLLGSWIPG
jgi:hypothetical protein